VVHFDHGRNFPLVRQAIDAGFTSAMLDVSHVEEHERIKFVKDFVKMAHRRRVTIEVEEDIIGGREDYESGHGWKFTDPKRARQFTEATSVDCYAVSIGNTHGKPLPHETFDLGLISQINEVVTVPLVLHGASSTPDNLIREAISRGICKINIDTDLRMSFNKELRHTLKVDDDIYDPRDILTPTIAAVKETVITKMRLFGSSGAA
jgi:fructose-bisphosphate aldolase class II